MVNTELVSPDKICLPCFTVELYMQMHFPSYYKKAFELHAHFRLIKGNLYILPWKLETFSFSKNLANIGSMYSILFCAVYILIQRMEDGKGDRNYEKKL